MNVQSVLKVLKSKRNDGLWYEVLSGGYVETENEWRRLRLKVDLDPLPFAVGEEIEGSQLIQALKKTLKEMYKKQMDINASPSSCEAVKGTEITVLKSALKRDMVALNKHIDVDTDHLTARGVRLRVMPTGLTLYSLYEDGLLCFDYLTGALCEQEREYFVDVSVLPTLVNFLIEQERVFISANSETFQIEGGDGSQIEILKSLSVFDFTTLIPDGFEMPVQVDQEQFMSALKLFKAFNNKRVLLRVGKQSVEIISKSRFTLKADAVSSLRSFVCAFDAKRLYKNLMLFDMPELTLHFSGNESMVMVKVGNKRYYQLPLRLM